MTVEDCVGKEGQAAAELIVSRAEIEAEKVTVGERFDIIDSGDLSRNSQMSTVLRITTLNFARVVTHDSSYDGIHRFKRIR